MKHYKIIVYGRVQGVGFRYDTIRTAGYLGIKGFVKNQPDGSVYIEAEGEHEQLTEFTNWCKKGTNFAYVDDILVEEGALKNFNSFDVRY